MLGWDRTQGTVSPSLGLWHFLQQAGFARSGVHLYPSVSVDDTQNPADRETNHVATKCEPRHPLTSKVRRGRRFRQLFIVEESLRDLCRCWPDDEERLLSVLQIHGLQPRQCTPGVVKMAMGEGQNVNSTGFERLADRVPLKSPALKGVAGLEAFTTIHDGNAVRAFDQATTDGAFWGWTGRSRTENVDVENHVRSLRTEEEWASERTSAGRRCR